MEMQRELVVRFFFNKNPLWCRLRLGRSRFLDHFGRLTLQEPIFPFKINILY